MKKGLILILLVAVAAVGYFQWRRSQRDDATRLAGVFEARTIEVGSLVGGRVVSVSSQAGRHVAAGDLLLTFESDLLDLELSQQKARVAQARAQVVKAQRGPRNEDLERARIAYEAAQTDRRRFEQLWQDGVVGRRDFDQALVAEATARQTYLERARGSRSEDLDAAVATLEGEEQRLAYIERQRAELAVRAPAAGTVEVLDLRPGDLVPANAPVASILEDGQLWLRVFVPETRLAEIRLGMPVEFEVDGRPGERFQGAVTEIADRGEYTPRNLQTFEQRQDLVFAVRVLPVTGKAADAAGPASPANERATDGAALAAPADSPFKAGMSAVVHLKPAESAR